MQISPWDLRNHQKSNTPASKVHCQTVLIFPHHSPITYVNPSTEQQSNHFCEQICYTCEGVSATVLEICVMSTSGLFVYIQLIQLQFVVRLLFTDFCNPLPVFTFVAFRVAHSYDATMEDVKKALNDNDIDFNQLKEWNADSYRELSVR